MMTLTWHKCVKSNLGLCRSNILLPCSQQLWKNYSASLKCATLVVSGACLHHNYSLTDTRIFKASNNIDIQHGWFIGQAQVWVTWNKHNDERVQLLMNMSSPIIWWKLKCCYLHQAQVFCDSRACCRRELPGSFITHPAMHSSSARVYPQQMLEAKVLWSVK